MASKRGRPAKKKAGKRSGGTSGRPALRKAPPREKAAGGRQFAFHGTIVRRDRDFLTIQIFPGLTLDVRAGDVTATDEVVDEVTQRSYVRVELDEHADLAANFKPRLARLALEAAGVPFAFGGASPEVPHGLVSGGAPSLPPAVDPKAVAALAGKVPPQAWGALARAAAAGARLAEKYQTTVTTAHKTYEDTNLGICQWQTLHQNPIDGSWGTVLDENADILPGADDNGKMDETSTTKEDEGGIYS